MSEPTEPQPAKREKLKGQPVWVKVDQYDRLKAISLKTGKPLAAHARRAIEAYLRRHERQTLEVRA